MSRLPDPRRAPHFIDDRTAALATELERAIGAGDRTGAARVVRSRLRQDGSATVLPAVLNLPPGAAVRGGLEALDTAINGFGEGEPAALLARVFLVPILFVTGGKAPARVAGVIPDIGAVTQLLKQAGALGAVENFGLSNALGMHEAATAIGPADLFALVRSLDAATAADLLPPGDLVVDTADEQVHLRYLAGASLTPADMPTFLERAGQVGRWGMPLSQMLARQLGDEGLSLLPLPRAPQSWFEAMETGQFAREEIAFNLFATGAIRRIRGQTGDPEVLIAAQDDGTIRVELTSPFDPMLRHSHAWRLSAADDLVRVELSIRDLLRDCRVDRIDVASTVMPVATASRPGPGGLLAH